MQYLKKKKKNTIQIKTRDGLRLQGHRVSDGYWPPFAASIIITNIRRGKDGDLRLGGVGIVGRDSNDHRQESSNQKLKTWPILKWTLFIAFTNRSVAMAKKNSQTLKDPWSGDPKGAHTHREIYCFGSSPLLACFP